MYVLMDIEWVQNKKKMRCPTQIAAMRVDECWRFRNIFYTRIVRQKCIIVIRNRIEGIIFGKQKQYYRAGRRLEAVLEISAKRR